MLNKTSVNHSAGADEGSATQSRFGNSSGHPANSSRQRQPICQECEKSLPNQIAFDKIESIVSSMQKDQNGLQVKTAKSFMSKIPSVFTGSDLIQWLVRNMKLDDQQEAAHLANLIASHGYIFPIEDHTLSIKNDCTFYRFQTPCLWPSNNTEPENTDYAVYLCKRTMQGKARLELADYEAESLARLQRALARKWEFIYLQAESQAKVDKRRDKLERKVLDSQERAFWDVYRPVPGCVNTTELDIKKACRLTRASKKCPECQKLISAAQSSSRVPSSSSNSSPQKQALPAPAEILPLPAAPEQSGCQAAAPRDSAEVMGTAAEDNEEIQADECQAGSRPETNTERQPPSEEVKLPPSLPSEVEGKLETVGADCTASSSQPEEISTSEAALSRSSSQRKLAAQQSQHHLHHRTHCHGHGHHHHHHHHHPHLHPHQHQHPHHHHHHHHHHHGRHSVHRRPQLAKGQTQAELEAEQETEVEVDPAQAERKVPATPTPSPTASCELGQAGEEQEPKRAQHRASAELERPKSACLQSSSCELSAVKSPLRQMARKKSVNLAELARETSTSRGRDASASGAVGARASLSVASLTGVAREGAPSGSGSAAADLKQQQVRPSKSICESNDLGVASKAQAQAGGESHCERVEIGELERQLESLRMKVDRRVGGVQMAKVTQSYLSYFQQWAEYDPFISQPIPSNPWCSDSVELWYSERQTKDVHSRRVRRWAFSLKELLSDPAGREQFHRFLEKEFSAENLKFWDAVQELKRVPARDVARQVEAIWKEYLAQDANCPINIDSKSYEISKKNMDKNVNNRYIFDEAASHVYQLMRNDSYPRYLRSDMYKEYKETSEKRRPNQVASFDVFKPQITNLKQKFNF